MVTPKLAAIAAALIATVGLAVASIPSAAAATHMQCQPQYIDGAGLNAWCRWYSDIGYHAYAEFDIYQQSLQESGANVWGEVYFGADIPFAWHWNVYTQQCVPGNIPASCGTMAANGGDFPATRSDFSGQDSAKSNSFGHVYRACGSAVEYNTDGSVRWEVLNVCSPFIAN